MAKKRQTRLIDIARGCGLSVSSVGEIIKNPKHPRYPIETRQRVLATAHALGYRADVHASALVTGKSRVIGFSCGVGLDMNWFKTIAAAEKIISKHGHHMLLHVTRNADEWYALLAQNRVDFLVVTADRRFPVKDAGWHRSLRQRIAIVGMKPDRPPSQGAPAEEERYYIWSDTSGAGRAIEHLAGRGHRNIAILRGARELDEIKVAGALKACRRLGLREHIVAVESEENVFAAGRRLAATALDEAPETTALFCRRSDLAPGVYAELRARKKRIPRDVSVIAYYDHQDILGLTPPLTCIAAPLVEATSRALHDYFSGVELPAGRVVRLQATLIERDSVAAVCFFRIFRLTARPLRDIFSRNAGTFRQCFLFG